MMATKKRTTKALKAKTARRPAPKRKPRPWKEPCPVLQIMKGQAETIECYNALVREWRKAPASSEKEAGLADQCRAVRDKILGRFEAISHVRPRSTDGALYLLMLGYCDLGQAHTIKDPEYVERRRRRGLRCLHMGYWFFHSHHCNNYDFETSRWLMPYPETQDSLLWTGERDARH